MLDLDEVLQPGQTFRIYYGENALMNKRVHILAFVDEYFVVFKSWGKHKRRWFYEVEHRYYFELMNEHGLLIK